MVFAAGLGHAHAADHRRDSQAADQGRRADADRSLPRPACRGRRRARRSSTCIGSPTRSRRISRPRVAPKIVISDERATLLDQGGGIKKALPLIGDAPFFICNTDAFWIEGPRSNSPGWPRPSIPRAMDALLLVAASGGRGRRRLAGRFHHGPRRPTDAARAAPCRAVRLCRRRHRQAATVRKESPRTSSASRRSSSAPPSKGRLYGVRLDGFWLHVGRPRVDRRGGAGDRPVAAAS